MEPVNNGFKLNPSALQGVLPQYQAGGMNFFGQQPQSGGMFGGTSGISPDLFGDTSKMFDPGYSMGLEGGAGAGTGWKSKLGTAGTVVSGLADLAGIWAAIQSGKTANKQLDLTKGAYNRDVANQAKLINGSLEARYRQAMDSRGEDENSAAGRAQTSAYMQKHGVDGTALA